MRIPHSSCPGGLRDCKIPPPNHLQTPVRCCPAAPCRAPEPALLSSPSARPAGVSSASLPSRGFRTEGLGFTLSSTRCAQERWSRRVPHTTGPGRPPGAAFRSPAHTRQHQGEQLKVQWSRGRTIRVLQKKTHF